MRPILATLLLAIAAALAGACSAPPGAQAVNPRPSRATAAAPLATATRTSGAALPSAPVMRTPAPATTNVPHPSATLVPATALPSPTTGAEITLVRAPYVQRVTTTTAEIVWTTAQAGQGEVRYSGPDGAVRVASASEREASVAAPAPYDHYFVYEAPINGLAADTEYSYHVYTAGADLLGASAPPSFHTAAEDGPFTFVVLGDSGDGSKSQLAVRDRLRATPFDFALHVGDLAYGVGTYEQFERYFFGIYADLLARRPFWPVPGNHDYVTAHAAPYLDVFVLPENAWRVGDHERYYSFDWGNAHFVALDTNDPLYAISPSAQDDMADWLAADLAASPQTWKIVFEHHSPYSTGPHGGIDAVRARLAPIFEQYHVAVVFAGHDHDYERTVPILAGQASTVEAGGVTYVITGGGGAGLYPVGSSWFTETSASRYELVQARVDGCTLALQAIATDADVLDQSVIRRC